MRVGVIGVQGNVSEHAEAVREALRVGGFGGEVVVVRSREDLAVCHALTIPGGESTAISRMLASKGLREQVVRRVEEGMPVLGTCAGCILLAKEAGDSEGGSNVHLLQLVDMAVDRNAFGRQRESFEADLVVDGLDGPFRGVFIRAPAITRTWGDCQPIARFSDAIVAARQGHRWATCFHPELGGDPRLHVAFLAQV